MPNTPIPREWPQQLRFIPPYFMALLVTVIAVGLRYLLDPVLGHYMAYQCVILAIGIAAWYGGIGPSLLAFTLGTAAMLMLFYPIDEPLPGTVINLALYAALSMFAIISGVAGHRKQQLLSLVQQQVSTTQSLREQSDIVQTISRIGQTISAELDLQRLVQAVTDAATELTTAEFGAFFYNLIDQKGEQYTLYTLSGAPREAFEKFPLPRNTQVFAPTFHGISNVRSDDITQDPRYGQNPPFNGMPKNHLPVVSYLAVPVVSRSGEVLGGLFFGHHEVGVFTERHEQIVTGLAAQAAIAIDNARLFQRAIRERQQLEVTLTSIGDAVIVTDDQSQVTFMNPVAERLTGWELGEAKGLPLTQIFIIVNETTRQPVENPVAKVIRENRVVGLANHTILIAKDRKEIPIDDSGAPIRDEVGRVSGVVLVFRDITQRKLEEAQNRLLYDVTSSLSAALTPDEVAAVILEQVYTRLGAAVGVIAFKDVNAPLVRIAYSQGLAAEVAARFGQMDLDYPAPLTDAIRTGEPIWIPNRETYLEHYPNLEELIHQRHGYQVAAVVPLMIGTRSIGALGLSFPSTRVISESEKYFLRSLAHNAALAFERARLYAAEHEARQMAEKADALKMNFLAMVSHELRTPLTSIKGFITTLLSTDVKWTDEQEQEFLEIINTESNNLEDLVSQILDLSRLNAGVLAIDRRLTTIQKIYDQVSTRITALCRDHQLEVQISEALPGVLADERRIAQVLINLIENACKYSQPGMPIRVTATALDGEIHISVSDEGVGIPPDERESVFEAFHQASNRPTNSATTHGAGLGLAISRALISAHGGRIQILDHDGPGTTFRFCLPVKSEGKQKAVTLE